MPDLLQGAVRESQVICHRLAGRRPVHAGKRFRGFAAAWPAEVPGRSRTGRDEKADNDRPPTGPRPPPAPSRRRTTESQKAHWLGDELLVARRHPGALSSASAWASLSTCAASPSPAVVRVPPLRWVHRWLYHRMYFDELYFAVFVGARWALSRLSAWFDRHVVDGLVNLTARWSASRPSAPARNDRYVIDGAVNGVGRLARDVVRRGAADPASGRIRART